MAKLFYKTTGVAMNFLASILRLSYRVEGRKNIPKKGPILFVVNHFTRFETFFIPYVLYQTTGMSVKTLAAAVFFRGFLGKYLNSIGAISVGAANRNKMIISDLMTDNSKWVIYPEGMMVKNKSIIDDKGKIALKSPYYKGLPRTGAAVLSLKAEVIKQLVWENMRFRKLSKVRQILSCYDAKVGELSRKSLNIVPVTITYYPMRPASNTSLRIASAFAGKKKLPQQIVEELKVEGSLLENSKIVVSFSEPFNIGEYVKKSLYLLKNSGLVSDGAMIDYVLNRHRFRLTREIMKQIYFNLNINYDHLLTLFIFHYPKSFFTLQEIQKYLFNAIIYLFIKPKIFCLQEKMNDGIHHLLCEKPEKSIKIIKIVQNYLTYAVKNNYLNLEKNAKKLGVFFISKEKINKNSSFEKIRIENPLHVIYNEFRPLFSRIKPLIEAIKKEHCMPFGFFKNTVDVLLLYDREIYRRERALYKKDHLMKDWEVGTPRFFKGKILSQEIFYLQDILKKKINQFIHHSKKKLSTSDISSSNKKSKKKIPLGVVISHGYKSSPKEVVALAKYLNQMNLSVYVVRLTGHGNVPEALKSCDKDVWLEDYHRATQVMLDICDRIVLIGFSAGGILALRTAADFAGEKKIVGVVSISAPIFLQSKAFKLPPYIVKWNELCNFLHINKLRFDFIEDTVENIETNYRINYLKGVAELGKIINETKKELKKIFQPILILQGDNDPVVKFSSANFIYANIKSKEKYLHFFPRKNHVIVRGRGKRDIFYKVGEFISNIVSS